MDRVGESLAAAPFGRVARTIRKHLEGIVAYVATGLSSARSEGINGEDPHDYSPLLRIPRRLEPHRPHQAVLRGHHALAGAR